MIALKSLEPFQVHFMIYAAIALPIVLIFSKRIDPEKHPHISRFLSINNFLVFVLAWLLMFFDIFEAVVQAFVITMLTITYLSLVGKAADKNPEEEVPC